MKSRKLHITFLVITIGLILVLGACSARPENGQVKLQSLGPAPELENEVWINTDQPLRLAELRGNVVLLEMWTYG